MLLLLELAMMSLLFVAPIPPLPSPGFNMDLRAVLKFNGGKNAGNENPAAAAACSDCKSAAECSWALRRNSATDVVRGSFADDVGTQTFANADERFALNDEIDDVDDDVIVGQHEHKPGNPKYNHNILLLNLSGKWLARVGKCQFYDDLLTVIR